MTDESLIFDALATLKKHSRPRYSKADREAKLQGDVWIRVLVDSSGAVREALLYKSSGTRSLDDAALAAAPKNVFEPAQKSGHPTHAWVTYRVVFSPQSAVEIQVL